MLSLSRLHDHSILHHYLSLLPSIRFSEFKLVQPHGALVAQKGVSFPVVSYIVFFPFLFSAAHGICYFSFDSFTSNKVVQATWAFVVSIKPPAPVQHVALFD